MNTTACSFIGLTLFLWTGSSKARSVDPTLRHHQLRESRIAALQQDILDKLGLQSVPRAPRYNMTISEHRKMLKVYKKTLQEQAGKYHELYSEEEYFAQKFHSFEDTGLPPTNVSPKRWRSRITQKFYFDVNIPQPSDPHREHFVTSATLRLFQLKARPQRLGHSEGDVVRLDVYQLLEAPKRRKRTPRRLVNSQLVSLQAGQWMEFNLKSAVKDWIEDPASNYGIEIDCETHRLSEIVEFYAPQHDFQRRVMDVMKYGEVTPTLNIHVREKSVIGRQKRSNLVKDCTVGSNESKCCRYPLNVNFAEIGWDFITYPQTYQAYYCAGSCPQQHRVKHAFSGIQSAINIINPAAASEPCCSASKLRSLTVVYRDDFGKLSTAIIPDMVVEECMCS